MLSFLKRRANPNLVRAELDRIMSLMSRFEGYGVLHKERIVSLLNSELGLAIPPALEDPERRIWPLPGSPNLAISFNCSDLTDRELVTQFVLTGFKALANCLIIGSTGDRGESYTWSISNESPMREIPPLTRALQGTFWSIPGYQEISFGERRFLLRRLHG